MNRNYGLLTGALALALSCGTVSAADIQPLVDGEVARAADVNGNFTNLNTQGEANTTAIQQLQTDVQTIELTPGPQGEVGSQGPPGFDGPQGPQGLPGLDADMTLVNQNTADIQAAINRVNLLEIGADLPGSAVLENFRSTPITVDCAAGDSLQDAIDGAPLGTGDIIFTGTCTESITIDRGGLRLFGTGAEIVGTIAVRGASRDTLLLGFTLTQNHTDSATIAPPVLSITDFSRVTIFDVVAVVSSVSDTTAVTIFGSRVVMLGGSLTVTTTGANATAISASSSALLVIGGTSISTTAVDMATSLNVFANSFVVTNPSSDPQPPNTTLAASAGEDAFAVSVASASTLFIIAGTQIDVAGDVLFAAGNGLLRGPFVQQSGITEIVSQSAVTLQTDISLLGGPMTLRGSSLVISDTSTGINVVASGNASVFMANATNAGTVTLELGSTLDVTESSELDTVAVGGITSEYRIDGTSTITNEPI